LWQDIVACPPFYPATVKTMYNSTSSAGRHKTELGILEVAHLVLVRGFSRQSPDTAILFSPLRYAQLSPTLSKDISRSDISNLKLHYVHIYESIALKAESIMTG